MPNVESEKFLRIPIYPDRNGVLRVGNTRVSLLSVLAAFDRGDTPEQIVHSFPALALSQVYAVVTYYLMHREELDTWMEDERKSEERIQEETEKRFPQDGIRERLLKRKSR